MIRGNNFYGEHLILASGYTRDMDLTRAEILLFEQPEHPLPQASWKSQEDNHRILSVVEFLSLRQVILELTITYSLD